MDDKAFQEKLADFVREIEELPEGDKSRIRDLADQARDRQEKLSRTIGELTESLDHLRLSVKYLVFDLEATRRENRYLRKMLESQAAAASGADEAVNADEVDGDAADVEEGESVDDDADEADGESDDE